MKENETGKTQLLVRIVGLVHRNLIETRIIEIWIHAYGYSFQAVAYIIYILVIWN